MRHPAEVAVFGPGSLQRTIANRMESATGVAGYAVEDWRGVVALRRKVGFGEIAVYVTSLRDDSTFEGGRYRKI